MSALVPEEHGGDKKKMMNLEKILRELLRQLFLWMKRLLQQQNSSRFVMNH